MITVKKCLGSRCGYSVLYDGIEVDRQENKQEAISKGKEMAKKYLLGWGGFITAGKKRKPSVERSLFKGRHK